MPRKGAVVFWCAARRWALGLISQARARTRGAATSIRATYVATYFSDSIDSYISN